MIYADSSILIAWVQPRDPRRRKIESARNGRRFALGIMHRLEIRHNLRADRGTRDGDTAWQAWRASEASTATFDPITCSLRSILEKADKLSEQLRTDCGAWDLAHIAAAQMVHAEEFWTADAAQREASAGTGIPVRFFA